MKTGKMRIEDSDRTTRTIITRDLPRGYRQKKIVTEVDWLNGKQGSPAACALSYNGARTGLKLPHNVKPLGFSTTKRRMAIITKRDAQGHATHGFRANHDLDVARYDEMAKSQKGTMPDIEVVIRAVEGRDRYGRRKKWTRKSNGPVVQSPHKRAYSPRGIHGRDITRVRWAEAIASKFNIPRFRELFEAGEFDVPNESQEHAKEPA